MGRDAARAQSVTSLLRSLSHDGSVERDNYGLTHASATIRVHHPLGVARGRQGGAAQFISVGRHNMSSVPLVKVGDMFGVKCFLPPPDIDRSIFEIITPGPTS